jgi:hypothetical protein
MRRRGKRVLKRLRTIPWFIRVLVGLFLAAQLAGVVSSPRAIAAPPFSLDNRQFAPIHGDHADQGKRHDHHDHSHRMADTCCGLHACFAGVLPLAAAVETDGVIGKPISVVADDLALSAPGGRLDRPPRPLH